LLAKSLEILQTLLSRPKPRLSGHSVHFSSVHFSSVHFSSVHFSSVQFISVQFSLF